MNYSNDVREIIAFINSAITDVADGYFKSFAMVISPIDEEYLQQRADYIIHTIDVNPDLQNAFSKLETVCNGFTTACSACPIKNFCNTYIKNIRAEGKNGWHMVDLFCGAGGLSLGFSQEGFITVLANDIEDCCVDTYAHNHPETPRSRIIKGDIRRVVNNIDKLLDGINVDIVIGGPPCQGFSMANRQRLIDDPRNHLYKSFVEVVKKVQPKFFVMENVKGMLSVADQVREDFGEIGYSLEYHVLNARDYGVPQNRERLIYIGNKSGEDNGRIFREIFDLSNTIPEHVLGDALYGLRELKASQVKNSTQIGTEESGFVIEKNRCGSENEYIHLINQGRRCDVVCNHKARYNNDRDIEIFGRMEPGNKSDDPKIADIMPYARRNDIFKDKYYKLQSDKVCKTITAHMKFDCNMYIHPSQARGLTPREAARVQSYPDDYFFRGAYTKTYMQIGNSVPPLLGRALAKVIKKYI